MRSTGGMKRKKAAKLGPNFVQSFCTADKIISNIKDIRNATIALRILSLSLSLSRKHIHTCTSTQLHTHIHTHTLTRTQLERCPWCNGYRRRNWTRRYEFKSWTRLMTFHIALIPLGKV